MDLDTNQNSQCKEKNIDVGEQPVSVENTAILECLEVVMSEYKIERDKKQSFETRAGIIMALLGATCGIFFGCIKFSVGEGKFSPNAKFYTTLFYILVISFHSFKIINCDLEDYNVIQLCFKKIIS
ncbi:hypothetical protein [Peptostreptococcus sp.]